MPDAPMPAQGAGDTPQQDGGILDALRATDSSLSQITEMILKNDQVPDQVKSAFQASLQAFRQGLEGLNGVADGSDQEGSKEQMAEQPSTPEQGASGAQPMSMRRPG